MFCFPKSSFLFFLFFPFSVASGMLICMLQCDFLPRHPRKYLTTSVKRTEALEKKNIVKLNAPSPFIVVAWCAEGKRGKWKSERLVHYRKSKISNTSPKDETIKVRTRDVELLLTQAWIWTRAVGTKLHDGSSRTWFLFLFLLYSSEFSSVDCFQPRETRERPSLSCSAFFFA